MCLGIPMQIKEIDGFVAHCEAKGVRRDINLFLMQEADLQPGDYVLVHVGYALQKVSEAQAQSSWELFDEILESQENPDYA